MITSTLLHALLTSQLLFASPGESTGNEGPHGGDYIAAAFVQRGNEVLQALRQNTANAGLISATELERLVVAIASTPIASIDSALYKPDGSEVDALTVDDPTSPTGKSVQLARARWERMLTNNASIHSLVFHEYLWVIGANPSDENYRISSHLKIGPDQGDSLSRTVWSFQVHTDETTIRMTISFNHDHQFNAVMSISDDDQAPESFGMRSFGHYALVGNTITFHRESSSCPLSRTALGYDGNELISARFDGNTIELNVPTGTSSLILQRDNTTSASFIRWGCISSRLTFTEYNALGEKTGKPRAHMPAAIRHATSTGMHQAIAYSYATGAIATSWNWPDVRSAWNKAMESCNVPDCQVVTWAANACAALAVADQLKKGESAWNINRSIAENAAINACNQSVGGGCRLAGTICSSANR